jgi:hypothetical protein
MCKLTCHRNGELLATKELVQLLQRSLKITLEKSVDFTRVVARKNYSVFCHRDCSVMVEPLFCMTKGLFIHDTERDEHVRLYDCLHTKTPSPLAKVCIAKRLHTSHEARVILLSFIYAHLGA